MKIIEYHDVISNPLFYIGGMASLLSVDEYLAFLEDAEGLRLFGGV